MRLGHHRAAAREAARRARPSRCPRRPRCKRVRRRVQAVVRRSRRSASAHTSRRSRRQKGRSRQGSSAVKRAVASASPRRRRASRLRGLDRGEPQLDRAATTASQHRMDVSRKTGALGLGVGHGDVGRAARLLVVRDRPDAEKSKTRLAGQSRRADGAAASSSTQHHLGRDSSFFPRSCARCIARQLTPRRRLGER